MRLAALAVLTVLALLAQTSLLPQVLPVGLRPDLPVLVVLTWGLAFGGGQGLIAAAFSGVLLDSLSAVPFGAHLLALVPAVLLGAARETDLFASRASLPFVLVPLSTLGYYVVLVSLFGVAGREMHLDRELPGMAGALVVNALVSPLLFLVSWGAAVRYSDRRVF